METTVTPCKRSAVAIAELAKKIVSSSEFEQLENEIIHGCEPFSITSLLGKLNDRYGDHPIFSYYYGLVWDTLGDAERAHNAFLDALWLAKLNPYGICKRSFHRELGSAVFWVANYRRTHGQIEESKRLLSTMPTTVDCMILKYQIVAEICIEEGKFHDAIDALFYIYDYSGISFALVRIAFCQSRLGLHNEAAVSYKQALNANPENAILRYNMGCALIKCGEISDAISAFRHAYKFAPGMACIQNNLAYLLAQSSKADLAIRHAKNAVRLEPYAARNHDTLAYAYLTAGRNEDALKSALKALSLDWDHAEAWFHAGVANWRLGNHSKAYEILAKLKSMDLAWTCFLASECQQTQ